MSLRRLLPTLDNAGRRLVLAEVLGQPLAFKIVRQRAERARSTQSTSRALATSATGPITEPVTESVAGPTLKLRAKLIEPVAEPAAEPVAEPVAERQPTPSELESKGLELSESTLELNEEPEEVKESETSETSGMSVTDEVSEDEVSEDEMRGEHDG